MKKEDVRKGLECCQVSMSEEDPFGKCQECPYNQVSVCVQDCRSVLCKDALELVWKQIPVKPVYIRNYNKKLFVHCRGCLQRILKTKYCPHCGQAVKWD